VTAQITTLIRNRASFELVRDRIATILTEESLKQQELAVGEGLDPRDWTLRVFTERSTPWTEFDQESDTPQAPIVSVWFETSAFDKGKSNVISRQQAAGTFHVDCYGYGFSRRTASGHTPGDLMATEEASRAARLVRSILMSGPYVYLGFPQGKALPEDQEQIVCGRWVPVITAFQPAQDDRPVERVTAMRVDLEVNFNEVSFEHPGVELEEVNTTFARGESGEWFSVTTPTTPAP
jgi:hypothetical protein